MTVRSLFSYCNAYYMNWVSNSVLTDIRDELFTKMLRHSMDFFNRMQSGFLMSRITNDTRVHAGRALHHQQRSVQAAGRIISGVAVLLYMDWKFTLVTLVLFPSCLVPISILWKTGAQGRAEPEQEDMGQMVVTMQETFAGIRVIKSFAREEHQEKTFRRSNQLAVPQHRCASSGLDGSGRPAGGNDRRLRRRLWPCFTSISPT